MQNPYEILFGLVHGAAWRDKQNATKKEIQQIFMQATKANMTLKKYQPNELMLANDTLLQPHKRLAADFMFPARFKTQRPAIIDFDPDLENFTLEVIDINALDSNKPYSLDANKVFGSLLIAQQKAAAAAESEL